MFLFTGTAIREERHYLRFDWTVADGSINVEINYITIRSDNWEFYIGYFSDDKSVDDENANLHLRYV